MFGDVDRGRGAVDPELFAGLDLAGTPRGKQVAFVRDNTVVWAPKITTPIDGTVLQLSGELTPEQAARVAGMLRDGS